MNRVVQNILGFSFIAALAVNRIFPMNGNIPSKDQVYMFAITILLFVFNHKRITTEANEIVARTDKRKYYVQIAAIYIQLIFLVNNLGLDAGIISIIASIATFVFIIYSLIKR